MADRSQPARTARERPNPGRFELLRARYPRLDRLVRAAGRYQSNYGDYYAAAITYFSVLALVPLLMIVFAVAGFVLASDPELLQRLQSAIAEAVPSPQLSELINGVVDEAIEQAGTVGVIGLLAALYSGLGWMTNLREALTAQWSQGPTTLSFLRRTFADLLALFGLGLAMAVSFGISALGGGVGRMLFRLAGFGDSAWAGIALWLLSLLLSLAASWLVFLWVLARLPRRPVTPRSAVWGALFAAVGFEVLKQVGVVYLNSLSSSPAAAAFGPILGLLVFAYLTSRFLLFVTAWTASARENQPVAEVEPPPPAVIRPVVPARRGVGAVVGVFGLGTLLGWLVRGRR
ncbi:inner membrane protein YhjD [Actinopolyspora erythraea]|uniref:Inner membrane protein YhjD n=1 Tax=Actinopolyspora erythraea TaxID=414996 RepID=A0A099D8K5_9ACTN|nr:YhjD/YihY/BrkB family envelope integrity protein [Actinopolyspora erythraea]ASU80013.1 inner membrane protein YhjD [Actinopolyspora erythraea]KGI82261.1 trehalose-6-phosphate synthase [Actinopolyspora erythraea]